MVSHTCLELYFPTHYITTYYYSCILFQQITWLIKKIMWLKLQLDSLFNCHLVGWNRWIKIVSNIFETKSFNKIIPFINFIIHDSFKKNYVIKNQYRTSEFALAKRLLNCLIAWFSTTTDINNHYERTSY